MATNSHSQGLGQQLMEAPWFQSIPNQLKVNNPYEEDFSDDDENYTFVVPAKLHTVIFSLVEKQVLPQIKKFYEAYPHLVNRMKTDNGWTPFMYAARYYNLQMMEYFLSIGMNPESSNQSLLRSSVVHAAIYSKDIRSVKFVINRLKCSANTRCSEGAPLKAALVSSNTQIIELLISRGAYYTYKNVMNNVVPIAPVPTADSHRDGYTHISVLDNSLVHQTCVVQDKTIKPCNVKTCLQWARVRPFMHLRRYAQSKKQEENHHFSSMAQILANNDYYNLILGICLGDGSSILTDGGTWVNVPYSEQQGHR